MNIFWKSHHKFFEALLKKYTEAVQAKGEY